MQAVTEILAEISKVEPKLATTTLLALDGPSGAGKTTLAMELHAQLDNSAVIHMDDLYAGWGDALSLDLYARIFQQIFQPILRQEDIRFQVFNWQTNLFDSWQTITPPRFLILEGVGAAAIPNRMWISLAVFMHVSDEVGLERVRSRDGDDVASHIPAWQIMQREHFLKNETDRYANVSITT